MLLHIWFLQEAEDWEEAALTKKSDLLQTVAMRQNSGRSHVDM